jgi:hypothetical protein
MDALEQIARLFAEDIKKYIESGGTLDDLDVNKIYKDSDLNEDESN